MTRQKGREGPNGCRQAEWAPDPRSGNALADGFLYVTDVDDSLWMQTVTASRRGEWILLLTRKKTQRARLKPGQG